MSEPAKLRNVLGGIGDYFFGRNLAIGIATLMLLTISGYATWSGMNDFIVGVSATTAAAGREIPGGLSISTELLVIAIVIALTFLMWLALRETFRARQPLLTRAITLPLYIFLAIWSIGFGYGFWWSLIAGEEATRKSMAALQEDAQDATNVIAARVNAVQAQLDNVVAWSDSQMAREDASGGSCGVPSKSGRGPLYNARRGVRDSVAKLRERVVSGWLEPVQRDLDTLRNAAATLPNATVEERQRNFERRARDIRSTATTLAARSNAFGQSTALEMRALAETVGVPPETEGFSCYDPTLAKRLRLAADTAALPAVVELPEATFTEGPAGVAAAVKRLWANVGSFAAGIVAFIFSGGEDPGVSTKSGAPIRGRDLIALLVTLGIDIGLLVLTSLNRPLVPASRADGLATPVSKLRLPSGAVVRQLASAIATAVARAPGVDLEWVRWHFIHHGRSSFFVIPNLYSIAADRDEELRALAINQLAGVFDDVDLVRALTEEEFKRFGEEEERRSFTDLGRYRREYAQGTGLDIDAEVSEQANRRPIRNHGLLSKAQRALKIAGWSDQAQRDVEIYRLVDVEGLTPLLTLLNEATIEKGAEAAEEALELEPEPALEATPEPDRKPEPPPAPPREPEPEPEETSDIDTGPTTIASADNMPIIEIERDERDERDGR